MDKQSIKLHSLETGDTITIFDVGRKIIKGKVKLGGYIYLKSNDARLFTYGEESEKKFIVARKYRLMERIRFFTQHKINLIKIIKNIFAICVDLEYMGD